MPQKKRIRRRARRKAPAVRRGQIHGLAPGARSSASELIVGGALDPAEKAADQMADRALSGQGPIIGGAPAAGASLHRKCTGCAAEEEGNAINRVSVQAPVMAPGASSAPAPKSAAQAVNAMGSGRRMNGSERAFFEPRFGREFSDVRIHEGPSASRATRTLDARAFAHGTDIAFDSGERTCETMAHELAHVVQDKGEARRTPLLRRACATCPSPVNPEVEATIQPVLSFGTPSGSKWGSTNWGGAKSLGVSIWHRERNSCVKKPIAGKNQDIWEVCPRKIKLRASVPMVIDKSEIKRTSGGKRWWMECNAPAGSMMFDTEAAAKAAFTTPKKITVAGVIHHENYHVTVSKKAVETAIKARADLTKQIVPYAATEIAKWKAGLEKTMNTDTDTQLKGNPSEPNEELNAATAECTQY